MATFLVWDIFSLFSLDRYCHLQKVHSLLSWNDCRESYPKRVFQSLCYTAKRLLKYKPRCRLSFALASKPLDIQKDI